MRVGAVLLFPILAAAVGCGPPPESDLQPDDAVKPSVVVQTRCDARTCRGCCDGNVCVAPNPNACGINGAACVPCPTGFVCTSSGTCLDSPAYKPPADTTVDPDNLARVHEASRGACPHAYWPCG